MTRKLKVKRSKEKTKKKRVGTDTNWADESYEYEWVMLSSNIRSCPFSRDSLVHLIEWRHIPPLRRYEEEVG